MSSKLYVTNKKEKFVEKTLTIVNEVPDIVIDEEKEYQTNLGFGGAITEASSYIYSLMNEQNKKEFISSIYSNNGLNYSLGRLHIGSCDFCLSSYDLLDEEGKFSLKHEEKYLFPLLKDIEKEKSLEYLASSWSPLAVQKTNQDKKHGGKLLPTCYEEYASYLVEYIDSMNKLGYKITMMTIQNEPQAVQIWESCIYEPDEEGRLALLIKENLQKKNLNDVKLLIWDHNRDVIVDRVEQTLKNPNVNKITDGIAYHFYDNNCSSNLSTVHNMYEDKILLFTEGCVELLLLDKNNPEKMIGSYENGLRYAKNYLRDSENFSNGFIDWNILLDSKGGPNHVGNYCEAPIMYDIKKEELIYNYSYYMIGHFSRFIEKNSRRIRSLSMNPSIEVTSYKNPDGSIVVVIINQSKDEEINIKIKKNIYKCCLLNNSIATIHVKECD